MSNNGPLDAIDEIKSRFADTVLKGVLDAHATGLGAAAALIGDVAQEVANDQIPPEGAAFGWQPSRWTPDQAQAVSKVLSDLNDKIMARIKSVNVITSERGG